MKEISCWMFAHLKKSYKKFPVLKGRFFSTGTGDGSLDLFGKNGAGKTTLMKSLLGLNTGCQGINLFSGKTTVAR